MRILFLTSRLPYPPNRGDRLRVFNFIRSLSPDHEISLVSFIRDDRERKNIPPLTAHCKEIRVVKMSPLQSAFKVGINIWRRQPLQSMYYRSGAMRRLIEEVLSEDDFDVIYVHLFRMAQYVETKNHLYRVVDLTDVVSQELIYSMPYRSPISKLIYSIERPRIESYEQWVANHFNETWLISENDHAVLSEKCPDSRIMVIRNGVDTKVFRPTRESPTPYSLLFVGHMGVFHNMDAASLLVNEILPLVRQKIPEATLKIVGASPKREIIKLGELDGVEVTGYIPDLNAILNQSSIFVAPLRFAAGVQNKILEAMAAGTPVVTTSLVNQGLGAQQGKEIIIADSASSIAVAVVSLFKDAKKRHDLSRAGREFIKTRFNWGHVSDRIGKIQSHL